MSLIDRTKPGEIGLTNDVDLNGVSGDVAGAVRTFANICSRVLSSHITIDDLSSINLFVTVRHSFSLE